MFSIKRAAKYFIRKYNGVYVRASEVRAKVERMLSEQGSELDRIGFINGTDKSSLMIAKDNELIQAHDYLRHYDFVFSRFRANTFSMIEFGCAGGNSLRTWEQYFPEANIYGVDLNEATKQHEKGRVHIVIGDATSQETYDTIKAKIDSAFIILDDASHAWSDQRRSFELFWDMLMPGGFYVIEDLVCGTRGAYTPPKILDAQPFFAYMQDRCEFLRWCPDWQPEQRTYNFWDLPEQVRKIEREMDMCIFVPGAIIVRKK